MGEKQTNLIVRIPEGLKRKFDTYVTSKGLTMTTVINALVNMYMEGMTEEQRDKLLEKYS